jgi:hypothetical protein
MSISKNFTSVILTHIFINFTEHSAKIVCLGTTFENCDSEIFLHFAING